MSACVARVANAPQLKQNVPHLALLFSLFDVVVMSSIFDLKSQILKPAASRPRPFVGGAACLHPAPLVVLLQS